jgi:hypothetical protein
MALIVQLKLFGVTVLGQIRLIDGSGERMQTLR